MKITSWIEATQKWGLMTGVVVGSYGTGGSPTHGSETVRAAMGAAMGPSTAANLRKQRRYKTSQEI